MLTQILILFALVLAINLLPAFGPPTWTIVALYGLHSQLPLAWIVLTAALAAASGRVLLALAFRHLRAWLPERTRISLEAARSRLAASRRSTIIGLGLFAVSPLPSAQLFEAAGLANVRLAGFTLAFFGGRIVSYFLYALTSRTITAATLGDAFRERITSAPVIVTEIVAIVLLALFVKVDWPKLLARAAGARRRRSK